MKEERYTPPASVASAAKLGLKLRKQYRRGGTDVGVHTATLLSRRTLLSPGKVRHIANYFPRHAGDRLDKKDPPSNGWIAWLLWGGHEGRKWANQIMSKYKKSLPKMRKDR